VWGAATNGVKGGIILYRFHDRRAGRIEAFIARESDSTSWTNGLMYNMPGKDYLFSVSVIPITGKQPRLSAYGKKFQNATPPKAKLTQRDRTWIVVRNEFPRFLSSFHISDYFEFESEGVYELEVELTLYQARKLDRHFGVFKLPPIRTRIKIEGERREDLRAPKIDVIRD
jgi:hypothetical protein